MNPDIKDHFFAHRDSKPYLDKVHAVGRDIESRGAGFAQIKAMGEKYEIPWFRGLKQAPDSDHGFILRLLLNGLMETLWHVTSR